MKIAAVLCELLSGQTGDAALPASKLLIAFNAPIPELESEPEMSHAVGTGQTKTMRSQQNGGLQSGKQLYVL